MRHLVKSWIKDILSQTGYYIQPVPRHLWNDDKIFLFLLSTIQPRTLLDPARCFMLYQLAKHTSALAGDVAEIGVYKGGTAKLLVEILNTKKVIHLFDTFEGMPSINTKEDIHKKGDFYDTSVESVKQFIGDCSNVFFHKGFFPETAQEVAIKQFCFVHIDVDIFQSVKDCLEFFYNRTVPGGIIILDDYAFPSCPGAKKAADEFYKDKKESLCLLPTNQAFMIKI